MLRKVLPDVRISDSYQDVLDDHDIEAIYIGVPTAYHEEWTIKALNNKKFIIVEKPYRVGNSFQDIFNLYPDARIAVGWMYRHQKRWESIFSSIRQGIFGAPKHIQFFYSYLDDSSNPRRHRFSEGGGALSLVGCYGVHLAQKIFQEDVVSWSAVAKMNSTGEADLSSSISLEFANGTASISSSLAYGPCQTVDVFLENARIHVDQPINADPYRESEYMVMSYDASDPSRFTFDAEDHFASQIHWFEKNEYCYDDRKLDFVDNPNLMEKLVNNIRQT